MTIDQSAWHYEVPDFPRELADEQGGVHIAFFLRWMIENGFSGAELQEEYPDIQNKVKNNRLDAFNILTVFFDGVLLEEDFTSEGARFANAYYLEKETFSQKNGNYLEDYETIMSQLEHIKGFEKIYQGVIYNEFNYKKVKEFIDKRFRAYQQWLKKEFKGMRMEMAAKKTKIFAHRGSKGTHPENTLPAFEEAVNCSAEGIELDVHLSQDGHLIVMHDEKVDRTTDGKGRITDMTLAQIKELDGGSWFSEKFAGTKIPTLQEVTLFLQEKGYRGTLNIEIKTDVIHYEGIEQKVNDWMMSQTWPFTFLYSSFYFPTLEKLALIAPDIPRALIMFAEEELIQQGVYSPIISGIHPKYTWIEKQSQNVSDFPKDLRPWTVNKKGQMIDCFNKKLAAIHTDYPEKALNIRKEWQKNHGS